MRNAESESRGDAERIENLLSEQILDAAIEVHRTLGGPGLTVLAIHKAQVLTYLRLTQLKLGIVANFGQTRLVDGWNRVVNNL